MLKVGSKWISKQLIQDTSLSSDDLNFANRQSPPSANYIELFDSKNIDSIQWPATEEGEYAKNFLLPMILNGAHQYIDNVQTEIKILKINELILPISINDAEYENSYVCSPYTYYISYAQSSLDIISNRWLKSFFKGFFYTISNIFKQLKFNKVVIVNNWLLPTNLYPRFDPALVPEITQFIQKIYPQHAIVFRSIDAHSNDSLYNALKDSSYKLIASRQIFFTDTNKKEIFETRIFKSDLKLLQTSGYEIVDDSLLTKNEISRILDLYKEVYINKYSKLNPQLNENYLKLALDHKILRFKALKKEGVIDGITGYFSRNGIITCPFFGYDKSKPQQIGLYRLLSTTLMLEAKKQNKLFHQSAGASVYKKIRRAQDHLEYIAVYDRHLPLTRRLPWFIIKNLINTVGIFYMKKY
jgi:hypothetical protein